MIVCLAREFHRSKVANAHTAPVTQSRARRGVEVLVVFQAPPASQLHPVVVHILCQIDFKTSVTTHTTVSAWTEQIEQTGPTDSFARPNDWTTDDDGEGMEDAGHSSVVVERTAESLVDTCNVEHYKRLQMGRGAEGGAECFVDLVALE